MTSRHFDLLDGRLLEHPTLGTIEPLPDDDPQTCVVRLIPPGWDFDDEPADARDSLPLRTLPMEELFVLLAEPPSGRDVDEAADRIMAERLEEGRCR